ncbi:MAG: fused MFS/spermidine synthase [Pseudomonadota bacterium]
MRRTYLPFLVFLSGACALAYEIAWGRMFSNVFGNSTHAIALVVAVFMAGLGVGAFIFGGLVDRARKPLLIYAALEAGIGAFAFLVPVFLEAADPWIARLYAGGAPQAGTLLAVRLLIATLALAVPTCLMGATLPVVTKLAVRGPQEFGRKLGLFYGLNTAGSMVGCVLTGFFLLPGLGVTATSYSAAIVNGLIAVSLLLLQFSEDRGVANEPRNVSPPETPPEIPATLDPGTVRLVQFTLFFSGFAALSYELIWSRVLGFQFLTGMGVISFTVVVAVFLGGLAGGGLLYGLTANHIRNPIRTLGLLHVLSAASVLFFFWLLTQHALFRPILGLHPWVVRSAKALVLIAAPTFLLGYTFPLACKIVTTDWKILGRSVGKAFALNTIGSVLGPLITGFFLIPLVGSEPVLKGMVVFGAGVGAWLVLWDALGARSARFRYLAGAAFAVVVVFAVAGPRSILLSIMNVFGKQIVYFSEGSTGAFMAFRTPEGIELMVGGTWGAGTTPSLTANNEMAGYLPLLLHPDPKDVAVICFGTGRTTSLFARNPRVRNVDVVEIMGEALVAGRKLFSHYNAGVLDSPKVNLVLDDGFNFMKYTPRRFDVIVVDPFMPRNQGSAMLYTKEFLEFARGHLKPNGIVTLWAYPRQVPSEMFLRALKTFQAVFPHVTVWKSPDSAYLFFAGSPWPLVIDEQAVKRRLSERPQRGRSRYFIADASGFLNLLVLNEKQVRELLAPKSLPLFTVDRPDLEYLILKMKYRDRIENPDG